MKWWGTQWTGFNLRNKQETKIKKMLINQKHTIINSKNQIKLKAQGVDLGS